MPVQMMSEAELTKFEILRDVEHERMTANASRAIGSAWRSRISWMARPIWHTVLSGVPMSRRSQPCGPCSRR